MLHFALFTEFMKDACRRLVKYTRSYSY